MPSKGWYMYELVGMTRMYDRMITVPIGGSVREVFLSSIYPLTDEVVLEWMNRVNVSIATAKDPTIGVLACPNRSNHINIGSLNCECRGETKLITGINKTP